MPDLAKSNVSKDLTDFIRQDIQRFTWFTTYQRRDMLLNELYHFVHSLGIEEQARRKSLPDEFVLCPRCRGYHSEKENQDNLCEKCEKTVHTMEWDKAHGISS